VRPSKFELVTTPPRVLPVGSRIVVEQQQARAKIGTIAVLGLVALVGCSTAVTSGTGGEGAALAPAVADSDDTTTAPAPTTAAPTTAPASTLPPTTVPPTTVPPTVETTMPPTTTSPANFVPVAVIEEPLQAVGASSGQETARIQLRLIELGFWLSAIDGSYGLTTKQAVMAFEKYMGFDADGKVDQGTADALTTMTLRPVARADSGTLVEVDKAKQLLYFVIDGRTEWILNTSTGNGEEYTEADQNTPGKVITGVSLTPSGLHAVNRERPEGWWEGDLGEIYRPKYFVGGVAVHGSNSIPNYPASHGCVRVSVPAMDWIWDSGIMPLDTPVWVHDGV
jgi:peptidoglycan hydrolase-like protein with peptidoglycan-binding domain